MRNFMSYDRRWLDEPHVGDHVGRSIWALGEVLSTAWVPASSARPATCSTHSSRSLAGEVSLRTAAYAMLGLARLDADRLDPGASLLERLVDAARRRATQRNARDDWRWFEDELTLRQRPPAAGADHRRRRARPRGRDRARARVASLVRRRVRARGRHAAAARPRGPARGEPAPGAGDEQPLDASALVEAELAAFASRGIPSTASGRSAAFDWFLGRNRLDRPLYDFATGGCSDGLGERRRSTQTKAPSRRSPFTAPQLILDAAGLPRVRAPSAAREPAPHEAHARALPRHPGNPILTAEPTGRTRSTPSSTLAAARRRRDRAARAGRGSAAASRTSPSRGRQRRRRLDGRRRAAARARRTESRVSSGDSRMRASSGSQSSTAS